MAAFKRRKRKYSVFNDGNSQNQSHKGWGSSKFTLTSVTAHWCWDGVNRTSVVLQDFWFLFLNREPCCFYLFFVSTLSKGMSSLLHFQGMLTHLTWRSSFPLYFKVLSDIVVRRFSQRLPQSYLQGHEGPHCHVEENLPHVSQFIQIHVGQTDECKG